MLLSTSRWQRSDWQSGLWRQSKPFAITLTSDEPGPSQEHESWLSEERRLSSFIEYGVKRSS